MGDYRDINEEYKAAYAALSEQRNRSAERIKLIESSNTEQALSKYLYPTMIILPIVVTVILILASKAHIAIKIITIILLIMVIAVYHLQQNNIDLLKYFSSGKEVDNVTK